MKNKKIEKLIYKSFDGSLTKEESEKLNHELANSGEIQRLYSRIKLVRENIAVGAETSFKPFFEERLMRKINRTGKKEDYLPNWTIPLAASFRRIALPAIIILIVLLTYNLNNGNKYSIETILGINKTNIEHDFDPIHYLIWSEKQ